MEPRILIISPVRNEAAHIERVVRSVAAQELRPARWIVLDDNSTDGTLELLESLAAEVPFMEVRERRRRHAARRRPRPPGSRRGARATSTSALATTDWREYTHIMKLDGDIELAPSYLRVLLGRFAADPRLGLAGGVLIEPLPDGVRRIAIPRHHVHGALKCYSRECFEAIGGVQERLGVGHDRRDLRPHARLHHDQLRGPRVGPPPARGAALTARSAASPRLGECAYITHYPPLVGRAAVGQAGRRPPAAGRRPRVPVRLCAGVRPPSRPRGRR